MNNFRATSGGLTSTIAAITEPLRTSRNLERIRQDLKLLSDTYIDGLLELSREPISLLRPITDDLAKIAELALFKRGMHISFDKPLALISGIR